MNKKKKNKKNKFRAAAMAATSMAAATHSLSRFSAQITLCLSRSNNPSLSLQFRVNEQKKKGRKKRKLRAASRSNNPPPWPPPSLSLILPTPAASFAAGFTGSVTALFAVCLFFSAVSLHWEMSQRIVSTVKLGLDVGCGRGILLNTVAMQLKKEGSSGRVVGLDRREKITVSTLRTPASKVFRSTSRAGKATGGGFRLRTITSTSWCRLVLEEMAAVGWFWRRWRRQRR